MFLQNLSPEEMTDFQSLKATGIASVAKETIKEESSSSSSDSSNDGDSSSSSDDSDSSEDDDNDNKVC